MFKVSPMLDQVTIVTRVAMQVKVNMEVSQVIIKVTIRTCLLSSIASTEVSRGTRGIDQGEA